MKALGNLLWILAGGLTMSLIWLLMSLLAFISIVGIPWARACWVISEFAFTPFGKEAINRKDLTTKADVGTSMFGSLGNVIWFVFAGFWLALGHAASGFICCITVVGIPFGIQHFKLAGLAMAPIGKTIVTTEIATAAHKLNAEATLERMRAGG